MFLFDIISLHYPITNNTPFTDNKIVAYNTEEEKITFFEFVKIYITVER